MNTMKSSGIPPESSTGVGMGGGVGVGVGVGGGGVVGGHVGVGGGICDGAFVGTVVSITTHPRFCSLAAPLSVYAHVPKHNASRKIATRILPM